MYMKSVELWLYTFLTLLGGECLTLLACRRTWLTNVLCSSDRHPSGAQSHSKRGGGEKKFTTPSQSNNKYTNITKWCDLNATEYCSVVFSIAAEYSVASWHSPVWINCFHN